MKAVQGSTLALGAALLTTTARMAQTELRITHATTGGTEKEVLDKIVADFEAANPDIKVKQIPFDDDIYSDTGLITQLQGQDVPDIYFQWAGFPVARDAEAGYAMDLTAALASDGWGDTFVPSVWSDGAGTHVRGQAVPDPDLARCDQHHLVQHRHLRRERARAAHDLGRVRRGDREAGRGRRDADRRGQQRVLAVRQLGLAHRRQGGAAGEYVAAFSQEGQVLDAGLREGAGLHQQLHDIGAFNKDMPGLGADPAMATFIQGAAAMHPIGSWLIGTANELADEDFHYAQFDTPVIDPEHPLKDSVIGTVTGFVIHAKAKNPDAAVKFLKFYTNTENQILRAEAGSLSPIKGVNEAAKLDDHTKAMAVMLAEAPALVPPPDTTYPVPVAEAYYQAAA